MERVPVFVISPVAVNALICFKGFPQVIQVWSCIGKFWPKGHKAHWFNPSQLFSERSKYFQQKVIIVLLSMFWSLFWLLIKYLYQVAQRPKGHKGPRGTKSHWVYPLIFLFLILRMLVTFPCLLSIFFLQSTQEELSLGHNYVNVLKNNICVKTVVAIIFRKINNKAHCRQKK